MRRRGARGPEAPSCLGWSTPTTRRFQPPPGCRSSGSPCGTSHPCLSLRRGKLRWRAFCLCFDCGDFSDFWVLFLSISSEALLVQTFFLRLQLYSPNLGYSWSCVCSWILFKPEPDRLQSPVTMVTVLQSIIYNNASSASTGHRWRCDTSTFLKVSLFKEEERAKPQRNPLSLDQKKKYGTGRF